MSPFHSGRVRVVSLLILSIFSVSAFAAEGVEVRTLSKKAAAREAYERDVDQAAMQAQDSAIAKLNSLLKRYRNTRQEPILLSKLAELQEENAAILFRISRGLGKTKTDRYTKELQSAISTLNTLIAKYPNYEEIAHAYFIRGKSYEELENTQAATQDYIYLVKNFPEAEETSPAYMSLAEFAITANNHPLAITYLSEIEKRPEDSHYPFALYKLAWSYYNIKNIPKALSYAEKNIAFYNARMPKADSKSKQDQDLLSSDSALRENTLLDVPLFYFEGLEEKNDRYSLDNAFAYFKSIEKGPVLGKMALRFAKLIRSRNMEDALVKWRDQFMASDSDRPEALDLVVLTAEDQLNKRRYPQLVTSAQQMVKYRRQYPKAQGFGHAQKLILDSAEHLQALIVKNKETEEARPLALTLAALYEAFTQIVPDTDPRIQQAHYNLAETLFAIHDYAGATDHYRWVVDHFNAKDKTAASTVADSNLKAIAARYEVLRQKKLIPTDLKAMPLPKLAADGKAPEFKTLDPLLGQWITWIDSVKIASLPEKNRKDFENFDFEACRAIYVQGDIYRAVTRLKDFAKTNPKSTYAIPAASLALDSYIATADWDRTLDFTGELMKVEAWKNSPFAKKLAEVAADSLYKKIEAKYNEKKYADTLADVDSFLANYPGSARSSDCLSLAGSAALAMQDKKKAADYFSRLIKTDKNPARIADALAARASIEEEQFQFAQASSDYRSYMEVSKTIEGRKKDEKNATALRKKILILTWISGNVGDLNSTLKNKSICTDELEDECDKYAALAAFAALTGPEQVIDADTTDKYFNHSRKISGDARTLWAAYTLQGAKHLAFRDRNLELRTLGSGYKDLDALSKYAILPYISVTVPQAFAMNRHAMNDVAPLRADEKYITHRVDMIHEMENAATKSMDLPWVRIRASVLNEVAGLYTDLSKGLADLPAPKGLSDKEIAAYQDTIRKVVVPFDEKGQDIRSKAFQMASRFAIEEGSFQPIAELFLAENPSQAKRLKADAHFPKPGDPAWPAGVKFVPIGAEYARELEFDRLSKFPVYQSWSEALQARRWPQIAFYMQEAKEKNLIPAGELGAIRAIALATAGARGEALLELEDARKQLPASARLRATLTLAEHYATSYSNDRARDFFKEIEPPAPVKVSPTKTAEKSPATSK